MKWTLSSHLKKKVNPRLVQWFSYVMWVLSILPLFPPQFVSDVCLRGHKKVAKASRSHQHKGKQQPKQEVGKHIIFISTGFLDSTTFLLTSHPPRLILLVVVQLLSCAPLFVTLLTAACQASPSFTISWSLLKLMSIESMMPSNHLTLCHPLLLLPSIFTSIRVFYNKSALFIRLPKDWSFSFSISPSMNIQDWFPLGLTIVWSPCCPRDSQEFSPAPQFKIINSSAFSLLYCPVLTFICDYWKNHSFDYTDLSWQNDVSAF